MGFTDCIKPYALTIGLVIAVGTACLFPATGKGQTVLEWICTAAIGLLFFFHGAKLSQKSVIEGASNWKLHLMVFISTYVLFPVLGYLLKFILEDMITPELYLGILFICAMPSTVQSSITLTSLARGNVPAAICSASFSNIIGMILSPVIIFLLIDSSGELQVNFDAFVNILTQLFLPFLLGQMSRYCIGNWVDEHKSIIIYLDQGWILLIVYTTFSAAVTSDFWDVISPKHLVGLIAITCFILFVVLVYNVYMSRQYNFMKVDEIAIVFCGSKKSLAAGIPMAKVLLSGNSVAIAALTLMLYHQEQLWVCSVMAQRYAKREEDKI